MLLTETWTSKFSNLKIKNFEYFHGPRPNSKRKAKRSSGGIVIYYKDSFVNKIELVNINPKGIIWIKFKKEHFGCEKDIYLCTCYIPPEDSNVYKDVNSTLFEFDFFEQLNKDIRNYSNLGNVYCTGDFNARTGEKPDHVENIQLDRYTALPDEEIQDIPKRSNNDTHVNSFGNRLLTLCKENKINIANGRLEPGFCTFHSKFRNRAVMSTVDYLITDFENFSSLTDVCVLDVTEFSDHCPLSFSLSYLQNSNKMYKVPPIKKIVWDTENNNIFCNLLEEKRHLFEDICDKLLSGENDIDCSINSLSQMIYDISYKCYGKTFRQNNQNNNKKAPWFNQDCRNAKSDFLIKKKKF